MCIQNQTASLRIYASREKKRTYGHASISDNRRTINTHMMIVVKKLKFHCCVGCIRWTTHVVSTELPDFPFTVILPIYDILDLYAYVCV